MASSIVPFQLAISDEDLADPKTRLLATRWPEREIVHDWSQGVPESALKSLVDHWTQQYDLRRCERWFNSHPQFKFLYEGEEIQFLHIRSHHREALPMLLIHGWPGSAFEFHKVIQPLTDPTAHGGKAEDAFSLVIPSLPGYGWSSAWGEWSLRRMATAFAALMETLEYQRWVAQGGDWGADIVALLASENPPASLIGVHMNTTFFDARKEIGTRTELSDGERLALRKQEVWETDEDGYFKLQATRPQTIGYALADSPVGQAAWIYEKIHNWSHHAGDVHDVLSKDEVLDDIMVYWLSNTGSTSARLYGQEGDNTALPIDIPVGVSVFPGDPAYALRSWGERYYSNIVHWRDVERGGHFAAWEAPDIFLREVRETFAHVR